MEDRTQYTQKTCDNSASLEHMLNDEPDAALGYCDAQTSQGIY